MEITDDADTLKVADNAPAGTVTDPGTDTTLALEVNAITAPPEGAALESVTVP